MPTPVPTTEADLDLVAACAAVLDVPKADPPSSFVLHAPLELLARALLLDRVAPAQREEARARLRWLVAEYEAAGASAPDAPALTAAPDDVVCSLAAAGHAPILLSLRPRVAAVAPTFGDALVATELARYPTWTLGWPRQRSAAGAGSGDLTERLAAPRSPGDPGSDFIYPTMHLTEASGLAAEVLDGPLRGMTVAEARRTLLRTAARSMLQDNPGAAPYGWTHCLTMPQAVLVTADEHGVDPDLAVAVAAVYVLGFRSTQGRVRLAEDWVPEAGSAVDRAWSSPAPDRAELIEGLATFGALHEDAHVAKYTLACFDAAEADPDAAPLFLAAAAHLHDWWRRAAEGGA
jgi:hypothetical protein